MEDSRAVAIGLAHIAAWTRHDWPRTKAMLAPDVRAKVATIWPDARDIELTGIEAYMAPKIKGARLIEPGSLKVLSSIGDERSALITIQFKIALGLEGAWVTMVRSCLYLIDQHEQIKEERDVFCILSDPPGSISGS